MKLVFVYWGYENAWYMLDLCSYARAARAMGHEVAIYGPPNPPSTLKYSQDITGADAIVFVFEWTTQLRLWRSPGLDPLADGGATGASRSD